SRSGPITIVGIVGDIQQKRSFGNEGPVAAQQASYIPVAQTDAAYLKMVHTWFSPSWFVRLRQPALAGTPASDGEIGRSVPGARPGGEPTGLVSEMARAAAAVDPLLPFAKFRTIDDVRSEAVATERAQTMLLGALAGLAVLLAAVGLYGLVANSVAERTRELGIRLALGASSRQAIAAAATPGLALPAPG